MMPSTPDQTVKLFAQHLSDGDLDAAVSLYDADATFLPDPTSEVSGLEAIREALGGFFALRPTLDADIQRVVEAGDTAMVINDWRLHGTLPDGSPVEQAGRSADVLRRQPDGRWLILIDDPWG